MNTLKVFAYIFLVIAIVAFLIIIIDIIRTKKCKCFDVTGIILSLIVGTVCGYCIYLIPNRSIADYVKPITTAEGINWNFKTNPQVCIDDLNGQRMIVLCPAWIEDNVQVCLSYEESADYDAYSIRLVYPKMIGRRQTSFDWDDKMYVRLDGEDFFESSVMTSFDEYLGCYTFRVPEFERMAGKGIISIAYRSPCGIGLWKRIGDEGMTAINEQLIHLVNYVDYVKKNREGTAQTIPQDAPVNTAINPMNDKNIIAERAKVVVDYFRFYNLKQHLEDAFSKEYRRLYSHAMDIPSDNPQGIGSEDWLATLSGGEAFGMFPNITKTVQFVEIIDEKTTKVRINYVADHEIIIKNEIIMIVEDGRWMLDDMDGSKAKLKNYIKEQRKYFKSPQWEEYLQRWLTEGDSRYSDEGLNAEIAKCRKEVEEYFIKYPE